MKKILLTCLMILGISATAQITVSESFEGTTLPSGWTSTTSTGSATSPAYGTLSGTACAGTKAATKNMWTSATSWYLVYSSAVSNAAALDYSFKYLAKGYSTTGSISGSVSADYSIDNGVTWTEILPAVTLSSPNATPIPCTTVSGTIPAGTITSGASFKFRIKTLQTGSGDYYMGYDDVKLTQASTTPPACGSITAPANAATAVSVSPTFTWASVAGANGYKLKIGTTTGASDVLNNVNVGNVTSYNYAGPLNFNTTYYATLTPTNAIGDASGCTEISFTTGTITCPVVSAPAAAGTNVSQTPTFTWASVPGATGYKISLGSATGGTDILNNVDVGNVTTYTLSTALALNTKYYYTVNSYSASSSSASCTERNFTTAAVAPPSNDSCSGALVASAFPYSYAQTDGAGSTNNGGFITSCSSATNGSMNDGLWFTFVGDGKTKIIKVTTTAFDCQVDLYSGSCGSFTCVTGADTALASGTETITQATTNGTNYFINVGGYSATTDSVEGNFTITIEDQVVLGTSDATKQNVSVYPNPFKDTLSLSRSENVKSITIVDMNGRLVQTVASPKSSIDTNKLNIGLYLVTIYFNDGSSKSMKVIKK